MESFKLFLLTYGYILASVLYQLCYFLQIVFKNLTSMFNEYRKILNRKTNLIAKRKRKARRNLC